VEPRIVADTRLECGEGTLWHEGEQKLYWLDIPNGSIYRYDPRDGSHERVYNGEVIGGSPFRPTAPCCCSWPKGPCGPGNRASCPR